MNKPTRQRKCIICKKPFIPFNTLRDKWCSPDCGVILSLKLLQIKKDKEKVKEKVKEKKKYKEERKEYRERKKALKTRSDYLKEAQAALNKWIREVRDADEPCISCGRHHNGQNHAGHYLARGSHPHLALEESNLAKQCMPCNVHLSGNQFQFRRGLIKRIGLAAVEALESDQTPRKYTIAELEAIKASYKRKIFDIRKSPDTDK